MKNKDKYLPGIGNPVQQVGRDMYGMGMNGYMANGYPAMMHPDPYMAQQQAMAGQMGGLSQYTGYQLPGSTPGQMSSAGMTTGSSYMNGTASYAYSMAPYMQGAQVPQSHAIKSESPTAAQQMPGGGGMNGQEGQGRQKGDLREMISMYLPTDAHRESYAAAMQSMQGQYAPSGHESQSLGNTQPLTHM